jgi:CRISPR/Cas system-associated endonuclease Cas1
MKKFSKNGFTVVFYQKENDKKFSFLIENEAELTEKLLASVKTKRVSEKSIFYAKEGIFEKLQNLNLLTSNLNLNKMENQNAVSKLNEIMQKLHGANITTEVVSKSGSDHNPTLTVKVIHPTGAEYLGKSSNRKKAAVVASEKALKEEGLN